MVRRVVVTGVGAVTPIGVTATAFWSALLRGESGIGPITGFDTTGMPTRIGGEVKGFDPGVAMPRTVSRRLDRFAQYALAAAMEAVGQSGLVVDERVSPRVGVLVGTGYGPNHHAAAAAVAMDRHGMRAVPPHYAVSGSADGAAGEIALRLGATGPSAAMETACATGTTCIGEGMRLIRHGLADVVVAGGADDPLHPVDIAALSKVGALSRRNDEPERASRPFDRGRDGFVAAAGAGILVLEDSEHARRRGASVLAEIAGYGATTDAHHLTAPHPDGKQAMRALRLALDDAAVDPSGVSYVNAHGTSTPLNDRTESLVIRTVFGEHAAKLAVSSIKSMTGHMIAGSGAAEAVATVNCVRLGVVPPTVNCDDPEDPGLDYVPHAAREQGVEVAVSNSFGFNGHNAVLVVKKWKESP
ncbi:beta-ketoacyl-ACP synthase II [Nonomuraea sp. NPDC003707]